VTVARGDTEHCTNFCLAPFLYLLVWVKGIRTFWQSTERGLQEHPLRPCYPALAVQLCQCRPLSVCPAVILEPRCCSPFWCETWQPVAWSPMFCREVEDSAYDSKLSTAVETGQRGAPFFLRSCAGCLEFALLLCLFCTLLHVFFRTGEPGGEESDE